MPKIGKIRTLCRDARDESAVFEGMPRSRRMNTPVGTLLGIPVSMCICGGAPLAPTSSNTVGPVGLGPHRNRSTLLSLVGTSVVPVPYSKGPYETILCWSARYVSVPWQTILYLHSALVERRFLVASPHRPCRPRSRHLRSDGDGPWFRNERQT